MKFDSFFEIFDLRWPWMTFKPVFPKGGCQKSHFQTWYPYFASILNWKNFEISPFLAIFDLLWPRITSRVLQSNFFKKLISKAKFLGIIRPLLKKIGIWPVFRDFWPQVISNDLETSFSEKPISTASFWGIICLLIKGLKFPKT